ncbi:MAG: ATP synthase F1 subunit gamma [Desulfovibrio sp.]|jgi:F-type H+-transporting ATPase subunit gamma|nr:ATP synthase F1 subunit gamma [Desulfovibrio sp.]
MASLKDVRLKIAGVRKTRQITKAMYMVASAKLRSAQLRIERFRPYADKFSEMLVSLRGTAEDAAHPLLAERPEPASVGIVIATSDRGLCGSFNAGIITAALKFAEENRAAGRQVRFYCLGRKCCDAVRTRGGETAMAVIGRMNAVDFPLASEVGVAIMEDFLNGHVDEVHMFYGEFISLARQRPAGIKLLPAGGGASGPEDAGAAEDYIYEPAAGVLLGELLPRYVKAQVYRGLLDTAAGENAARMQAMDNATRNCDDMADALTLLFNKTRQAGITNELIDIVGGVEALKG